MILVDWQIRNLCEKGLVEPFDPALINPCSLDIRLGESLLIDTETGFKDYSDFALRTKENPFKMYPGECVLACTWEKLNIPNHVACELKLKSSRAREGLSHSLAGWIDNGFHGSLTLELKNYTNHQYIPLYPKLKIGQIILYNTYEPSTTYLNGRYSGQSTALTSLDL